jgi:coenzyme F420-reducing hydrogenase beta subunit
MAKYRTVYGVKNKNESVRAASRSGGFFTAVTDVILDNGGVVYGCALNENFLAEHRRATTKEERDSFRGSKYVQSDIEDVMKQVEKDLKESTTVLFSGVPCQVQGLLNYLNLKNVDVTNLITIDLICHGVPSPKVWHDFLVNKFDINKVENVDFRDKKNFGWRDHVETVTVDGTEISSKQYTGLFYSHVILRESCFHCPYKKTQRVSDITIGDYWRIENNDKEFDDDKGVSFVKLNTKKGEEYFNKCSDNLIIKEFPLATSIQISLDHNYSEPNNRKEFWDEYSSDNLLELADKYIKNNQQSLKNKIKNKIKKIMKKSLKTILRIAG